MQRTKRQHTLIRRARATHLTPPNDDAIQEDDYDNDVGPSKDNRHHRRPYPRADIGPTKEHL